MLDFDFTQFDNKEFLQNFKEDSVRELIIAPLLKKLGFRLKDSKQALESRLECQLSHNKKADFQIGSNKKIEADLTPDYTLYVDSKMYCILDAKAPHKDIGKGSDAYNQVVSYAVGFDCKFFALCNGKRFIVYELSNIVFDIDLKELDSKFSILQSFFLKEEIQKAQTSKKPDSWYLKAEIPKEIKNPQKQAKARYFGCNAYFTRQSWDIVEKHIQAFTNEGDVVLDPFGGSGVTAIEAMMNGRVGIHTDLNPLSIFMTKALSVECDLDLLYTSTQEILEEFENLKPKIEKEAKEILKNAKYYPNAIDSEFGEIASQKEQDSILWIPQDEILPKGSDVDSVLKLFSKKQLVELAILRRLIFKKTTPSGTKANRIKKRGLRYSLLLAFYNTLTLINLTYHNTPNGGPASAITRYYRYRIAPRPDFLNTADIFQGKINRAIKGKKELQPSPSQQSKFYKAYYQPIKSVIKDFNGAMLRDRGSLDKLDSIESKNNGEKIFQADATNLKEIESQSIDFIYTDPPYGAKIPYLDLSTMWNAWLDLPVDKEIREKECIEKGSLDKTREDYYELMVKSLKEMYRVLKFNRWLVFVFQHQDPRLWQILRTSAEEIGFEYAGTMRQSNGQTTFKQRQFAATIVSGQLMVYFRKVKNKDTEIKAKLGDNTKTLLEVAKTEIIEKNGATLAEINDALIVTAMNEGFLDEYLEITDMKYFVLQHFDYDKESGKYHCTEALEPKIPLEMKAKYFLVNYFNKCKKENKAVFFSDICFEIIPKLTNGVTPDERFIKEILEDGLAEVVDEKTGEWRLKPKQGKQLTLF
ncbi:MULTISPECIES: DNA methyltransferase [Helicobacter]|uniref:DNA methyltransferase n=1 Tax=Helicobacter TaxID=209 RepID=UPI0026EF6EA1|nr:MULTISPECIES: DNA methyltransferase [Helicobacter]MDY5950496.1 DNA methyltransferase [Helicobacter sp.]